MLFSTINRLIHPIDAPHPSDALNLSSKFLDFFQAKVDSIYQQLLQPASPPLYIHVTHRMCLPSFSPVDAPQVVELVTKAKASTCPLDSMPTTLVKLMFIHAVTGCDTTSRIFGIGKKTAFQKFVKGDPVLQSFANAFTVPNQTPEVIDDLGSQVMAVLFGGKCTDSLATMRYNIFSKRVMSASSPVTPRTLKKQQHITQELKEEKYQPHDPDCWSADTISIIITGSEITEEWTGNPPRCTPQNPLEPTRVSRSLSDGTPITPAPKPSSYPKFLSSPATAISLPAGCNLPCEACEGPGGSFPHGLAVVLPPKHRPLRQGRRAQQAGVPVEIRTTGRRES
ncbi:hypothetical protein SKAU_G00352070 [Synaphobranchus kaupii]|uniref:Uncharacterized protein n=1 Tax=Synaphobranchus kaupii TaxID=118154 RepID=A0A9Q1IIA9_SYNKA|nr:hypothetical protein SKAU_G00352070 [Synaphobranchus kaupii]